MRQIRAGWLTAAAFGGMFVFGIVMAVLGASLPVLAARLRFDMAQAGSLFLVMNCAMLLSMLATGPLMDRRGGKLPLAAGGLLVAAALALLAAASSYGMLMAGIAVLGAGGGALNGATNTLVADLHSDARKKNSALNLLGVFFGFGALFMPFTVGALLAALGLGGILSIALALAALLGLSFLLLAFPPPKQAAGAGSGEIASLARRPLVLLFGFLLFFQSGNEFIVGGFASSYLSTDLGASIATASYLLAVYWGSIMLARIVLSRLLLRFNGAAVVMASGLAAAASIALLLLAPGLGAAAAGMALTGASFAGIYPTVLGLAGKLFEKQSGTVFGILFSIALTGGMILPWAVGQLAQAHGLRAALWLAAGNCIMIFLLQFLITKVQPRVAESAARI